MNPLHESMQRPHLNNAQQTEHESTAGVHATTTPKQIPTNGVPNLLDMFHLYFLV